MVAVRDYPTFLSSGRPRFDSYPRLASLGRFSLIFLPPPGEYRVVPLQFGHAMFLLHPSSAFISLLIYHFHICFTVDYNHRRSTATIDNNKKKIL